MSAHDFLRKSPRKPLTDLKVRNEKIPGRYSDVACRGLYFIVDRPMRDNPPRKSWALLYMRNKKSREMSLGSFPTVTLAEARGLAMEQRRLLARGIDPIEDRKARAQVAKQAGKSFAEVAKLCIADKEAGWRSPKSRQQWEASLRDHVLPLIGQMPVDQIGLDDVLRVLKGGDESLWTARPVTASRVRGRVESILDYATAHGMRSGDNPARWEGPLKIILPKPSDVQQVRHFPALPWREIPGFMAALRSRETPSARALEFLILSAARSSEVLGATWDEVDLGNKTWSIPGERMKRGRPHRVPLSEPALALLRAISRRKNKSGSFPKTSALIFPNRAGKSFSAMAMAMLLRSLRRGITVHGFRSTFRSWAAETTDYPREVCEAALSHPIGNAVEQAYQRSDVIEKRARLMQEWAEYCNQDDGETPRRTEDALAP